MSDAKFGKYRLIAELGHGGMADVFLAVMAGPEGSGFSKLTVVKRLRQNLADEPEFVEMLVDEARISARLNHPNVVQTNEVGAVGNQYFLAMEYLDGQPLHRIQHRAAQIAQRNAAAAAAAPSVPPASMVLGGVLPKECQYLVMVDTLAGLHHAHELTDYDGSSLEIVHRDVTPHNVFVTYQGQVKVVDFGIAKAVGRASETRQGVVKGKVRYMAPEQAMGAAVDRRADVFSVGVMLWEVAAGRRLWKDVDDISIVQALIAGNIPLSPKELDPAIPDEIDRICRRALAPRPNDRYASAEEMRFDLEQFLAESGALVHARRRLGAVVTELFADKRNEIRAIIEKQLAALTTSAVADSGSNSLPVFENSAASLTSPVNSPVRSVEAMAFNVGGHTSSGTQLSGLTDAVTSVYGGPNAQPAPAAPKKGGAFAAAAVGVFAALALAGVGLARGVGGAKSSALTHVPSSEPAVSSSVTSVMAPASEVEVKVSVIPATAHISLDGTAVPSPFAGHYPRDTKEHTLKIEAPGFEPHVESFKFEKDVTKSISLNRARATAAAGPAPWRPPPRPTGGAPATTPNPGTTTAAPGPAPPPAPSGKVKPDIDQRDPWKNN
jgi:eukaryotic-like serine/threonine-protein kinase